MTDTSMLIVHPGTGTVLNASECRLVTNQTIPLTGDDLLNPVAGHAIDDPMSAIWFTAPAVRDYFAERGEDLSDLSDEQVSDVGESALMNDVMWDAFGEAMEAGLAFVRLEARLAE